MSLEKQEDAGFDPQRGSCRCPTSPPPSLPPGITDLGVVELSERPPTWLGPGDGEGCFLTPTVLNDGHLQIVFTSDPKTADGFTTQTERTDIVLPGRQMFSEIDCVAVALTPTLKTK